jgi:hypothetical protein
MPNVTYNSCFCPKGLNITNKTCYDDSYLAEIKMWHSPNINENRQCTSQSSV